MPARLALESSTPIRVRVTVERLEAPIHEIKARDGAELKLTVADNAQIAGVVNSLSAVEVHLFLLTPFRFQHLSKIPK